jgi:hypothetical protein
MGGFIQAPQIPAYNSAVNAGNNPTEAQPQTQSGQTHGEPPTGTITAKPQPKTDTEAATSLKDMNSSFNERAKAWAKYAGVEYKEPKTHEERVALADSINKALAKSNPQEQQRFLSDMKAIGEPLGVNFGLRDKGGVALNDEVELGTPAAKIQANLAEPYKKPATVQPQSTTTPGTTAPTTEPTFSTTTELNNPVPTPGSYTFKPDVPNTNITKPSSQPPIEVKN